ncbi:hypothetical protein MUN82_18740 [Hymenobacter aerilatus]|uniref:Uncharacterized protein n=1 Tax=Hymenobacter aerilatus TaxID=2932251 RepID=A0A8T9SW76_9BACT|nr:hypothetical protein [Hymenobacter aerilatus]UOR04963.1 hypothetical protein MUN82_18740 [Hymenobacter aerilatus]
MRYLWLTSLLLSLGYLNSWSSWAQQATEVPATAPTPDTVRHDNSSPVYVLNDRFIVGGLWDVVPANIAEIVVYKGGEVPARLRSVMSHGVVSVNLKKRFKGNTKSLAAIQQWLKLRGPVAFQLEGQPLEDTGLRIVTDAIAGIDVMRPSVGQSTTVINIRLVRTNPRPTYHPPGTIMIRGNASQ